MPIACKLSTPELQKRKATIISDLKKLLVARQELENGFNYQLPGTDETLDWLTAFIKPKRLCFDFFNYELVIGNDQQPIQLRLTGPQGAKDFIVNELGL